MKAIFKTWPRESACTMGHGRKPLVTADPTKSSTTGALIFNFQPPKMGRIRYVYYSLESALLTAAEIPAEVSCQESANTTHIYIPHHYHPHPHPSTLYTALPLRKHLWPDAETPQTDSIY